MTKKTEDDVDREKEAVAKMVGAKSAMEAMISRHDRLVSALKAVNEIAQDMGRRVGEDMCIKTYNHGERGETGSKFVSIRSQLARIKATVEELT